MNLLPKGERKLQSHEIAKQVRQRLLPIAERYGARIKVAEVPPGPPVLQTLVAEVYGPTLDGRIALARADSRSVQADRRRRRCRLVRRGRSAEIPLRGRPGEGRAQRHLRGRHRAHACRWPRRAIRPGCCTSDAAKEDVPLIVRLDRASALRPRAHRRA